MTTATKNEFFTMSGTELRIDGSAGALAEIERRKNRRAGKRAAKTTGTIATASGVFAVRFERVSGESKISFERVGETGIELGTKIASSSDAVDMGKNIANAYFRTRRAQEEFLVITLDTKNVVTGAFAITRGTLDASLVHPRECFAPAIVNAASSVILLHNHPTGETTPSREDIAVTDRLTEGGELLGIDVLDHIVVGIDTSDNARAQSIRETV